MTVSFGSLSWLRADHGDDTTSTADVIFELLSMHAESAAITRTRLRVLALERSLARRKARAK